MSTGSDSSEDGAKIDDKNKEKMASTQGVEIEKMLPIRMISTVVRGFGRGSTDLGIPTANLDRSKSHISNCSSFDDLPCGIYWGYCRIGEVNSNEGDTTTNDTLSLGQVYTTAVSIGYNPTYGNEQKTVEPHLIAAPADSRRHASSCGETLFGQFYDQPIRLTVIGYLRPELPFEGLDKLIKAIKQDIVNAETLGENSVHDIGIRKEREWVKSPAQITVASTKD